MPVDQKFALDLLSNAIDRGGLSRDEAQQLLDFISNLPAREGELRMTTSTPESNSRLNITPQHTGDSIEVCIAKVLGCLCHEI